MESAAAILSDRWLWDVEQLERRYGLTLPDDFRAYLVGAAPAEEYWDDGDAIWWPVHRIRNIPDEYQHPIRHPVIARDARTYLFFADFMIWCWAWAICCGDGGDRGKVAVINGNSDRFVADSFSQFVERYVKDPESVF